jgi:hypothetical protein
VGDRAAIVRTSVVGGGGDLIAVDGESPFVERCEVVGSVSGDGIDVTGDRAEIVRCFASSVATGIAVRGDSGIVDGCDARYTGKAGISVVGDATSVRGNLVLFALGDTAGIVVDRAAGPGGGVVEANGVEDCSAEGIRLAGPGVAARANRVLRCGRPGGAGLVVEGDDCSVEGDDVLDCVSHALLVTGDRCTLTEVLAADAARDGFLLLGDAARVTAVVARRCGGEGIENGGAGTVVEGSTFLGNRTDVAIRAGLPFGSFAADNRFETGGPQAAAEIGDSPR